MLLAATHPSNESARRDPLRLSAESKLLDEIPLARAMQLGITAWDGDCLRMTAPLLPNINDKGCAFGGSLVSVMTLASWALIKLAADQRGIECDIYVQDSTVRYLAPLWDDFAADSRLAENCSFSEFFDTLKSRGKARLTSLCEIRLADGSLASSLSSRFVALSKSNTAQSAPDCRI